MASWRACFSFKLSARYTQSELWAEPSSFAVDTHLVMVIGMEWSTTPPRREREGKKRRWKLTTMLLIVNLNSTRGLDGGALQLARSTSPGSYRSRSVHSSGCFSGSSANLKKREKKRWDGISGCVYSFATCSPPPECGLWTPMATAATAMTTTTNEQTNE